MLGLLSQIRSLIRYSYRRKMSQPVASTARDMTAAKVKATVREAPWQPDFETAVHAELERQAWSFGRGYLNERVRRP